MSTSEVKAKKTKKKKVVAQKIDNHGLTLKQKRFCDEYIITGNGTLAAIRAGYSQKTAKEMASENLTKPNIMEYLEKRFDELDEQSVMKQKEVLQRLTKIGRREENEIVVVTVKTRKSYIDARGKKVIEEHEEPKLVEIPAKLSDTNKALELMGRKYALFTDKLNVEGTVGLVKIVDDLNDNDDS